MYFLSLLFSIGIKSILGFTSVYGNPKMFDDTFCKGIVLNNSGSLSGLGHGLTTEQSKLFTINCAA